ncbi:uncharacterized protein [Macrobrachium rosenbergii]|uniref:uncharacterized protein n=1 Tax=Macrobrachium rosenbergii TaxID=79674 RepID=UPI0034D57DF4
MYRTLLSLLLSASAITAQFQVPLLSQFVPSNPPITQGSSILFPPPPSPPTSSRPPLHLALVPKQVPSLESLLELKAPPPPDGTFTASPKFEDSPLRALETSRALDNKQKPLSLPEARLLDKQSDQESGQTSGELTPRPFVASPTTIRFTLDDVPDFLEPSVYPTIGNTEFSPSTSEESGTVLENPFNKDKVNEETPVLISTKSPDTKTHLFILTSTEDAQETSTWRPSALFSSSPDFSEREQLNSTPFSGLFSSTPDFSEKEQLNSTPFSGLFSSTPDFSEREQLNSTPFSFSSIPESDTSFRPSFVLPFLDHSSEHQNLFTVVETKNPSISSFLRSEAPNFLESSPEIFELNPVRVETEVARKEPATGIPVSNDRTLSKTPVPKPIIFSDQEKDDETITESVTKPDKPLPTRKTFHFEQEFLSLLKKNSPREKTRPEKNEPSFESNPFWFTEQRDVSEGVWRLKGGERAPTLDLVSQDSIVSPITLKNTLGGLFSASIRGLTPTKQKSEASLKILDDQEEPVTDVGITIKSFAQGGLSSGAFETKGITTTIKPLILNQNFSETRLKLGASTPAGSTSHGPKIVPVGEVGEVPHDTDGATAIPLPSLSATLKHGVQSLNVTAWVSGCPKLYGKAELICVIEHDAISNTAMTVMWKKKSFTEGRPQEHIMAENDLLVMEDERFSLKQNAGRYTLTIKDFRPKDCGTYECEAKAADTTAASQLLLFTCH